MAGGNGGLRHLAAQPGWRRWTLASLLARMPTSMTLIGLLLAGQQASGSEATGALLAGVATFTAGFAAPYRGARLDRRELRGGLQRACVGGAAVIATEAVALAAGAPIALLFVLAVVQGLALAAVTGGYRALLGPVVPPEDLPRANGIDAVFVEVAFVSGPALAGLIALVVGPVGVLVTMAVALLVAAVVTGRLPAVEPVGTTAVGRIWRIPGVAPVYGLAMAMGATVGLLEAGVPARITDFGLDAAVSGPVLSLVALGSGVGGVIASARLHSTARAVRIARVLFALFAVTLVPVGLAPAPVALGAALLLAGVPIAPLNALGALMLQERLPPGRGAQGFAVYSAAILIGIGLGQSLAGLLLRVLGAQPLLALLCIGPLAVSVVLTVVARRRSPVTAAR